MNTKDFTFKDIFAYYAADSDGQEKKINLDRSNRWMKEAGLLNEDFFSTEDTSECFQRLQNPEMTVDQYENFVAELCNLRNKDVEEVKNTMINSAPVIRSSASLSPTISKVSSRLSR